VNAKRPLSSVRVIELGGIGPVQFAGMLLGELGADVVRIDRPGRRKSTPVDPEPRNNLLNRGKRSIVLDLRNAAAVELLRGVLRSTDVVIEGFRPGVTERLGLGPGDCRAVNPGLVYGRVTGWGQNGPLAQSAGHDINYISVTGVVEAVGEADGPPQFPLSVLGDFAAGANYLVIGVLAALQQRVRTGEGDVVDAAMVDATLHLLTATHALLSDGSWRSGRKQNVLDGGAPFYGVYPTADGRYLAVGAIEQQFYLAFLGVLGLEELVERQLDRDHWAADRQSIADVLLRRTQEEWLVHFARLDACVSPVLDFREAARHPQVQARVALHERGSVLQAGYAPRFGAAETGEGPPAQPPYPGEQTRELLAEWGVEEAEELIASGAAVVLDA
jgi:alpha-methylacyl-CoA racemase